MPAIQRVLDIVHEVLFRDAVYVAMPAGHRLAAGPSISVEDLLSETFLLLPPTAGPMREYALLGAHGGDRPRKTGMVVANIEEALEAIENGLGLHVVSHGTAELFARPTVVTRPIDGYPPIELAVGWRREDTRPLVAEFVQACLTAAHTMGEVNR